MLAINSSTPPRRYIISPPFTAWRSPEVLEATYAFSKAAA